MTHAYGSHARFGAPQEFAGQLLFDDVALRSSLASLRELEFLRVPGLLGGPAFSLTRFSRLRCLNLVLLSIYRYIHGAAHCEPMSRHWVTLMPSLAAVVSLVHRLRGDPMLIAGLACWEVCAVDHEAAGDAVLATPPAV